MAETFVPPKSVAERYATHPATIWRWAADDRNPFPKPIKITAGCTRWRMSDLVAWENEVAGEVA